MHNFEKLLPNVTKDYGIPYDYGSVMHYSAYAFAIDDKIKTIQTRVNNNYIYKYSLYNLSAHVNYIIRHCDIMILLLDFSGSECSNRSETGF